MDSSKRTMREVPEGTDQSDYIRRLSLHIASLDELKIAQFPRRKGIEAVGVLGSDIYDKLEILHALRQRLRTRLFFTTGLDARYYHPEELKATKNLVVISGFGLALDRYYQKRVPPFRDHNQTAAFAAALCALGKMDAKKVDFNTQIPRVFEISKRGPIDLSVDPKSEREEYSGTTKSGEPPDIHPARHDLRDWWKPNDRIDWWLIAARLLAALIVIGGFVVARCSVWCDPKENSWESIAGSTTIACLFFAPVILLLLAPLYYCQRLTGEPFDLFGGGSMWPTEGLRLFAVFLAVHFVIKSLLILKCNQMEIAPAFHLPPEPQQPKHINWLFWRTKDVQMGEESDAASEMPPEPQQPRRGKWFFWRTKSVRMDEDSDATIDIKKLWAEYCARSRPGPRLLSTAIWSTLYLLAVALLWPVLRHAVTPYRGQTVQWLDLIVVFGLTIPASTFLTFFIVHATLLDARLARLLSRGKSSWGERVRRNHQHESDPEAHCDEFTGEYLDILLLARRTRAVTRLIYYPFIIISLLIVCRMPFFDNFDWPPLLILMFCFNVFICCGCVLILRRLAEAARKDSVDRLREQLRDARATGPKIRREAIEQTLDRIEKMDVGIFAPITRQPVIGALLLPSGSAGIWALLQYVR